MKPLFQRSIRRNRIYVCKSKPVGSCTIDKSQRNQCRACRLKRCEEVGMNRESVQNERGPRNASLKSFIKTGSDEVSMSSNKQDSFFGAPPTFFPNFNVHQAYQHHLSMLNNARIATALSARSSGLTSPLMTSLSGQSSPVSQGQFSPTSSFTSENSSIIYPETSSPVREESPEKRSILELAANLVLMIVRWSKFVPHFRNLPLADQILLLEESWRELFVLSAAQFNLKIDLATLTDNHADACAFGLDLNNLRDTIQRFQQLNVDPTEFACLRAIILFKTSFEGKKDLENIEAVSSLQDLAQITLSKYVEFAYPTQPSRFGKLLLLLPSLKCISSLTIEDVFFRQSVGLVGIEKIIVSSYLSQN